HLRAGILENQLDFTYRRLLPDIGQIRPVRLSAAVDHMTRGAPAFAEEKLLACGYVSRGFRVVCGCVERAHPLRQRLKLIVRKRESRHATGSPVPDQIRDLLFTPAPE